MYALRFIAYWPRWYRVGFISHFGNRQQMFEYVISYYTSISAGNIAVIYHDGPICRRNAFIGWPKQIYVFLSTVVIFYLTRRRSWPPSASDICFQLLVFNPIYRVGQKRKLLMSICPILHPQSSIFPHWSTQPSASRWGQRGLVPHRKIGPLIERLHGKAYYLSFVWIPYRNSRIRRDVKRTYFFSGGLTNRIWTFKKFILTVKAQVISTSNQKS